MAQDPYKLVQQEIQSALQAASHPRASYLHIRSTARGDLEELVVARDELRSALEALEGDLEELEGSVVNLGPGSNVKVTLEKIQSLVLMPLEEDKFHIKNQEFDLEEFLRLCFNFLDEKTVQNDRINTTSSLSRAFGLPLRYRRICQGEECNAESSTATTEYILPVEIYKHSDLTYALVAFCAEQTLPETCPQCMNRERFNIITTFDEPLPPVVVIQLKRYLYHPKKGNVKLKHVVKLPPEMTFGPLPTDSMTSEHANYHLWAVTQHIGNTSRSGHYWSKMRQDDGKWLKFNGKSETEPPFSDQDFGDTYMAFYRISRVDDEEEESNMEDDHDGEILLSFAVPLLPATMEW